MLHRIRIGSPTEDDVSKLITRLIKPNRDADLSEAVVEFAKKMNEDERIISLFPLCNSVDDFNERMLKEKNIVVEEIRALDITRNRYGKLKSKRKTGNFLKYYLILRVPRIKIFAHFTFITVAIIYI